ncbi:hypothetical protein FAZ19_08980 [Sphingobacterium alkalisoli]|uniref:Uncharacterized protein n=1 Tax=Sphingobacterium alkalisoli TaxID=1874115 RepID=A0A4U0H5U2_9SPHI|nr:hypothetical protein [Sphingobacterium alkalisoli]TJY67018.1 hypothetical protein FAZ19_08980 [Sphingobacterium alkalisoli]GGH12741.1 hypothetical protein GCM10011418_12500 [Sphingobacterium alkalisoli]
MVLSFTQYNLDKIENLFNDLGYKVRYEKGNFKTGACLIQNSKVVVVNKFSNLEIKILSLVQLLKDFDLEKGNLDDKQYTFFRSLIKVTA